MKYIRKRKCGEWIVGMFCWNVRSIHRSVTVLLLYATAMTAQWFCNHLQIFAHKKLLWKHWLNDSIVLNCRYVIRHMLWMIFWRWFEWNGISKMSVRWLTLVLIPSPGGLLDGYVHSIMLISYHIPRGELQSGAKNFLNLSWEIPVVNSKSKFHGGSCVGSYSKYRAAFFKFSLL